MKNNRLTVAGLRALKGTRQLTMLFVDTADEAAAASAAGIDILSIIAPIWTAEMRAAAGDCFVQVGLLYGPLCTYEDYIRASHAALMTGGDAVYCAASIDIITRLKGLEFAEAFALYEDALKENPDDYNSLYAIGRGAALSGQRLERGMEALARCLALTPPPNSPGHAAAHWRMGNIWEKKGDKAAARSAYEAALKLDAAFKNAIDALKALK